MMSLSSDSYRQICLVVSVLPSARVDIILTFHAIVGLIYVLHILLQSSVSLDDVFKILMDFRADESLCRGTKMWKQVSCSCLIKIAESLLNIWLMFTVSVISPQVCVWILDNEGNFKPPTPDTGDAVKSETVRSYIQQELETYLRVPASNGMSDFTCSKKMRYRLGLSQSSNSSGQTESLPNPKEADKLSRAILLCVDMESSRAGADISESLESLLSPLLETLSRVSTNIYLPVRKSDKSLQLVLRLFQHGKTPRRQHAGEEQGLSRGMLYFHLGQSANTIVYKSLFKQWTFRLDFLNILRSS